MTMIKREAAAVALAGLTVAIWACSSEEPIAPDPSGAGGTSNASSSSSVTSTTATASSSSVSTSTASTGEGGATTASSTSTGVGGSGGSAEEQGQGFVSGPRLRAKYYLGADGSKQFYTWHDNQRDEDCTYLRASDGKTRCLPVDYSIQFGTFFSDAACAQHMTVINGCAGATPKYAANYVTAPNLCHQYDYTVASVGAQFLGQGYVLSGGSCVQYNVPGNAQAFNVTPVDPTEFVEATVVVE